MHRILFSCLFILPILSLSAQCRIGDPCMQVNPACMDTVNYPAISHWVKAGVEGGIPNDLPVVREVTPGTDLQAVINQVNGEGGGVILLENGTYPLYSTLSMKNGVVLRGNRADSVILASHLRSTTSQGKKNTVEFAGISGAGLERLTIFFQEDVHEPIDRATTDDGGWCGECFQNNPHGLDNLYVRLVAIISGSNNCWVDGCRLLNSGTDPIVVTGDHNTLRDNYTDRSFNKGGGGNGYYAIQGDYNLLFGDTIRRIRHLAIQLGAQYNVITRCHIEVDVNFHNGDGGDNLIEENRIIVPTWHGWDVFATGGIEWGHDPPGPGSIMVNNDTYYRWEGPRYAEPNTIYTFTGYGAPETTEWAMPVCSTFYPVTEAPAGMRKLMQEDHLCVLPNPSSGMVRIINIPGAAEYIRIFDLSGRLLIENSCFQAKGPEPYELDLGKLESGLYLLTAGRSSSLLVKE